jgi:hypothetical protein
MSLHKDQRQTPPKSLSDSQHAGGYNTYSNFYEFVQTTKSAPSAARAQRNAVTCAVRIRQAKIRHTQETIECAFRVWYRRGITNHILVLRYVIYEYHQMKIAAPFRNKESRAGVIGTMFNNPRLQHDMTVRSSQSRR